MHSIGPFAVPLAPFLPIPSPVVYVMVGLGGMRLWVFLVLDLIGSLLWGGVLVDLGWALGQRAVDVAHAISHYALLSTVAIVVAIVAWQVWSARRDPRPPART
jgi:membrane protein DedA with SNARE-associated domain